MAPVRTTGVVAPCALAAGLAAVVGAVGVRGADYPAHLLRALLWEQTGASVWNFYWYAGHATPQYSVLAPPAVAVLGAFGVAAAASVAATYWFGRLTTTFLAPPSARLANYAFAVATLSNVVVGRSAFALGLALALASLWAWSRGALVVAVAAALLTPLTSPVAAAFLALAASGVGADRFRRLRSIEGTRIAIPWAALVVVAAAAAPMGVATVLFREPGRFPFRAAGLVASVGALVVVALVVRIGAVRAAAVLGLVAAVVLFLVPNPLGGNFSRLTQIVAVPLALAAVPSFRGSGRAVVVVAVLAGALWSTVPGLGAAVASVEDRSVSDVYHRPLVDEVRARNRDDGRVGRLEIPFTENHWETLFVAPAVPYARGWERQLDLVHNPELYDPDLSLATYHRWLHANAVRWIAVPDAPLDEGGIPEARLVELEEGPGDIPWLEPVWRNADWRLYEVTDHVPIVDPPARLVSQGPDVVRIRTDRPATVTLRYRYSEHFTISDGGCLAPGADGWITARLERSGVYDIGVDPARSWGHDGAPSCPPRR